MGEHRWPGDHARSSAGCPWLAERIRRESVRKEQIIAARLDIYADLLIVTARLADNAMTWSALPFADLKETDNDELDRVVARLRVVASQDVHTRLDQVSRLAGPFNRRLYEAKVEHQAVRAEGNVDDTTTILQRVGLGKSLIPCAPRTRSLKS